MGIIDTAMKGLNRTHMASVFKTEADQMASAVPFVLAGLEKDEKVVYLLTGHTKEEVVESLMKIRNVQGDLDAHRLEFFTAEETYLKGGRFEPDRMVALLDSIESEAMAQGFSATRGTGEMSWHSRDTPGSESLMVYEARVNQRYPRSSMNLLCQYDESFFDAGILLDAIRTHPRVVLRGDLCANPYYIPPEDFLSGLRGAVQKSVFDSACTDIVKRARFGEIHRLELQDMRHVSRRMAIIGGPALDDIQSQLSILSFYTDLALEAVREPSARDHLSKMSQTCASMQKRLDFVRSYQMVGESGSQWLDVRETFERIYQRVSTEGIHIELSVGGGTRLYADGLLERALEAIIMNIPDLNGKEDKVQVGFSEVGDKGLLSIQHAGRGVPEVFKSRLFECGYQYGRSDGFDLFLASEVLRSTGLLVRETGVPGRNTRFEITAPRGKYSLNNKKA